jgi:hypothetical protein
VADPAIVPSRESDFQRIRQSGHLIGTELHPRCTKPDPVNSFRIKQEVQGKRPLTSGDARRAFHGATTTGGAY